MLLNVAHEVSSHLNISLNNVSSFEVNIIMCIVIFLIFTQGSRSDDFYFGIIIIIIIIIIIMICV